MRKIAMGIGCAFLFWLILSFAFGLIYGVIVNLFGLAINMMVCSIAAMAFIVIGFIFGLIKG